MNKKWLSFKIPMQLIALIVITLLICATILYFYDTLAAAFNRLSWFYKPYAHYLALVMASIIGIGVLAESAPTIWEKLIYWGQCLDNCIIYYIKGNRYFIDEIEKLLEKTRALANKTNLDLQQELHKDVYKHYREIKSNCLKIHHLMMRKKADDRINQTRLERAKNLLNMLVMENLQISERINKIDKHEKLNY